jgi:Domain of unknown function (DUF4190)
MKRCPMCDRTYDDSQTFCVNDGATLISDASGSSYDPMKTIVATPPPTSQSAPLPPPPAYGSGDLPGGQSPSAWQSPPPPQGGSAWGSNLPPAPSTPFGAPQGQQNGLAIGSLVCGILSPFCCGLLTAIPAIVLGFMAINKIKAEPNRYGGRGMAIGGIVGGGLGILTTIIWIILQIVGMSLR